MKLRTKSKYGDESKGGVKEMNNNYIDNPHLVMNEKDMAAYLGISRYFLTELRKKHGLRCLMFEGLHCIYYYLPVVDEFFRTRSKGLEVGTNVLPETILGVDPSDATEAPIRADVAGTGNTICLPANKLPYKPMEAV